MLLIIRSIATLVLVLSLSVLHGQTKLGNPWLDALVREGIDLSWKQDYERADSLFQLITVKFPDHPAGYVYRAGLALTFAEDHETELNVARFDSLLRIGREKALLILADPKDSEWGHFFLGTADGTDSYAKIYRGDWLGGTVKGYSSVSEFELAVGLDSMLIDANAGIGAFKYWRSRKTEYFNWLPFVGDARPEAILLLRRAAETGIYNRCTALSMLSAIYLDAQRYDEAVGCARSGLQQYPTNRVFLWAAATALDRARRYKESAHAYADLLASLESDRTGNAYNAFVARLNLAESLAQSGDVERARHHLEKVLQTQSRRFASHLQGRVRNNLERARTLEKKLSAASQESR